MDADSSELDIVLFKLQAKGKIKCENGVYMLLGSTNTVDQLKDQVANVLGTDFK